MADSSKNMIAQGPSYVKTSEETFFATDDIPQDLRCLTRWCVWKREPRKGGDKQTKISYQVNGRRAKSNDPETWDTFAKCTAAMFVDPEIEGLRFMLGPVDLDNPDGDHFVGVDLDSAFDGEFMEAWTASIAERLGFATYGEWSPSWPQGYL